MQELPDGSRMLVKPDITKVDLPRLKQDSIKYSSAGVFPSPVNMWWQCFLDEFEVKYAHLPDNPPAWYLDHLKMIRATSQTIVNSASTVP